MGVQKLKTKPKLITGSPLKLDIGCGERKQEGHVGIDIAACPGVDHVMDVRNYPWPVEDASVDEIYTSHFFEHLSGPERCPFMDECWRILKDDGKMTVIVPYYSSMRAVQDPFHAWPPVCEHTFLYFNKEWRTVNKLTHYPISCDFNFGYGHAFDPDVGVRSDDYRARAVKNDINAVMDLHVHLTKKPAS